MFNKLITTCALAFLAMLSCGADEPVPSGTPDKESPTEVLSTTLPIADPYILLYDGTYYAYGTSIGNGFEVYYSDDLEYWKRSSSLA